MAKDLPHDAFKRRPIKKTEKTMYLPEDPFKREGLQFSARKAQKKMENNPEEPETQHRKPKLIPERLPPERLQKWKIGKNASSRARTEFHSKQIRMNEKLMDEVAEASARGEMLCTEDAGFLIGEETNKVTQWDIKESSNEITQQKIFDLELKQFGPYRIDYTRNGRHLLIGGQKGHIAAFDWQPKKLHCEINVMETVADVKWLHQETMFAVAQKKWTYIYDNQGIELHCLKSLDSVQQLEFLPYHFLMVSAGERGYLSYIDVSIGKEVSGIKTHRGRLDIMTANPQNAVISLGHANGTVSFWIPSMKKPAAKLLCHKSGLRDISIDATGKYMATTGLDRCLKIFDLRTYRPLSSCRFEKNICPGLVDFSQKGLLAVTKNRVVEVYRGMTEQSHKPDQPYMSHVCPRNIVDMKFCPYEDVLGLGHLEGFSSVVIPGSGEPNFDARESNPFQTKSQRKEAEVKMLLDKIRPEMITLDSDIIGIDLDTAKEAAEEKERNKFIKPARIEWTPRNKQKGGSSGLKAVQRKKGHKEDVDREAVREIVRTKQIEGKFEERNKARKAGTGSVLDRLRHIACD